MRGEPEKPRLRAIEVIPVERDGVPSYCLRDPSGETDEILLLSPAAMAIVARLDGSRDLGDLQTEVYRRSGEILPRATLHDLIARLDDAGFLETERFHARRRAQEEAFARAPVRPAVFAGASYPDDPDTLGTWIDEIVDREPADRSKPVRALVAPHIDPQRGISVYGSAYRGLPPDAPDRIVLLGISHAGGDVPFAVLEKDYDTPFGPCPADREFLHALCDGLPFDPRAGASLHRREHSLEFQALFLRRRLGGWEDGRRIVPILCCFPFRDPGTPEPSYPDSWRAAFTERLAALLDPSALIVLGVDFAHVGRRFGDEPGGVEEMREAVERADRRMMELLAAGDLDGFHGQLAAERDARRICGYPALRTLLEACRDLRGEATGYGQAVDRSLDSLVSFGAMRFG